MNAIKFEATISEEIATALPALRPWLGKRMELVALEAEGPEVTRALAEGARAKLSSLGIQPGDLRDAVEWARRDSGDTARPEGS